MADLGSPRLYCCFKCRNQVARHDDVVSTTFHSRSGRAFLFSHVMNVELGEKEDRVFISGLHTVADVVCSDCGETIGWKHIQAYDESQKFKEGKFVLEYCRIVKHNW